MTQTEGAAMEESRRTAQTPDAGVLEYERTRIIRKRGERGLLILAWVLGPILAMAGMSVLSEVRLGSDLFRFDNVAALLMALGLVAWGAMYLITALLFRRGLRWAGWTAGAMTLAMALGFLVLSSFAVYAHFWESNADPLYMSIVVLAILAALEAGLIAVVVEAWRALRVK